MKYVYLKQKVFSIRDEFKVYDENQTLLYEAKGKILTLNSRRDLFKAGETQPIYTMKQKVLTFVPTYFLYDSRNEQVAKMAQQLLAFFGAKFNLVIKEKKYDIKGDFFGFNFSISDEAGLVVQITKKFLSWGDTYQIAIDDKFDTAMAISVVLMIDDFIDDQRRASAAAAASSTGANRGGGNPPRGGRR